MPHPLHERLADMAMFFWSQVWRCTHKHPCKRCCWPWGVALDYQTATACWLGQYHHGTFRDMTIGQNIGAHRLAYILAHDGMLIFPGHSFAVCHRCDYAACCNPVHLVLGARADNARDKRGKKYVSDPHRHVCFPDGRIIPFIEPRL